MHQNQVRVTAVFSQLFGLKLSVFGKSDLTCLPVKICTRAAAVLEKVLSLYVANEVISPH